MLSRQSFVIFLILLVNFVNGESIYHDNSEHHRGRFIKDFRIIDQQVKLFTRKILAPIFEELHPRANINEECVNNVRVLLQNPNREWAAKMIDSSGRIVPSGVLSGTITDYGEFDQCMSLHRIADPDLGFVSGQYCWLSYRPPIPPLGVEVDFKGTEYESTWVGEAFSTPRSRLYYRIASGLCLPIGCHSTEIQQLLTLFVDGNEFQLNDVIVGSCQSAEMPKQMDFAQMASITIVLFLIICVIIGTLVDGKCCNKKSSSPRLEFWRSFSFTKNASSLFGIQEYSSDTNQNSKSVELTPIHGLRVLLILWVITCHTTNFAPVGFYDQPMVAGRFVDGLQIVRDFWMQFVISGSLSVQAFFIISGLISLHTSLKTSETFLKNVPYWKYVFFRWIRFAPPLVGMFCFQFLWPYFSTGPLNHWDFLKFGHEPCYQRGWANFLFVSNNYILTEQCGSHTWFLSADFQINLFAYFLIYAYVKNYRFGLRLNIACLVLAFVVPTLIHWIYNVPLVHILETDFDKLNKTFNMVEFYFFNHFSAYFAGMLIAGLLNLRTKKTLKRHIRRIFWWASIGIVIALPFSTYPFIQMDEIPANFLSLSYTGVKRFLWIASISWIVFASSSFSKNTLVARFLSAKIFQPLSRLTFCVYLVQSVVVWIHTYTSRSLHPIGHFQTIFRIGGVTLYSFLAAFILYILFEAPSVNLVRLLFKSHAPRDSSQNNKNSKQNEGIAEEREMVEKSSVKQRKLSRDDQKEEFSKLLDGNTKAIARE